MPEICDVTTVVEPPFVEVVDAVGGAQKDNGNRVGKFGRKRKEDDALPSNKLKKLTRGAGSFLEYQALMKAKVTAVAIATFATAGVVAANANADANDACFDADALLDAFDAASYDVVDDADAKANMMNVAHHLAGAYASVAASNVVAVA